MRAQGISSCGGSVPNPTCPKDIWILFQEPNAPFHQILTKSRRATSKEPKTKKRPKKELERRKEEKKRENRERERHLEIFRTISILYGAFCLKKKNEKGMMEKGRESDKFNDVCSKLRLEK